MKICRWKETITILALTMVASALGQITPRWTRTYELPGVDVIPGDTDIDLAGNVYAIGYKRIGSGPASVIVTKFKSTGEFLWVHEFSNPNGESGARIDVTEDGQTYVAMTHPASKKYTLVSRLTPAGDEVWRTYIEADSLFDINVREESPVRVLVLTHDRRGTPNKVHAVSLNENGGIVGQHWTIPPSNDWRVTDFEATSDGGFAYLTGGNFGSFGAQDTRLVFMNANGILVRQVPLDEGQLLATSRAGGGRVYTVGFTSATKLAINAVSNLGVPIKSASYTLPAIVGATLTDAFADESGSLFLSGVRSVSASVHRPLCMKFSYPGIEPQWQLTGGFAPSEVGFGNMEADPFGLLYVASVSGSAGSRVYGIDQLTGRVVGRAETGLAAATDSPFDSVGINSVGRASHAGPFSSGQDKGMFLQQLQGVNLRDVKLSSTSILGGTTVQGTMTMYLPLTYSRTVTLSSSSQYASVPPTMDMPAGSTSIAFDVHTFTPPTQVPITISADDGTSRRVFKFTVHP